MNKDDQMGLATQTFVDLRVKDVYPPLPQPESEQCGQILHELVPGTYISSEVREKINALTRGEKGKIAARYIGREILNANVLLTGEELEKFSLAVCGVILREEMLVLPRLEAKSGNVAVADDSLGFRTKMLLRKIGQHLASINQDLGEGEIVQLVTDMYFGRFEQ